jgi:hypothetical protein
MPKARALSFAMVWGTEVIERITPAATLDFTTFAASTEPNVGLAVSIRNARAIFCVWYNLFAKWETTVDWGRAWKVGRN